MIKPKLTCLHYSQTPIIIQSNTPLTLQTISNTFTIHNSDILTAVQKWWKSISKFKRTSFVLNILAIFGILFFVLYLFLKNKKSEKHSKFLYK